MKLKEIMTQDVEVVHPDDTLQTAARKMRERDVGFLPVCDGERLVGALSDRDVTIKAIAEGMDPRSTRVKDVVHSRVIWCYDNQNVSDAVRKMKENQVRRLMVIQRDNKQLVGVVSLGDLATNGTEKMSSSLLQSVSSPLPE
jgi:CBS domain-containing protein